MCTGNENEIALCNRIARMRLCKYVYVKPIENEIIHVLWRAFNEHLIVVYLNAAHQYRFVDAYETEDIELD